MFNIKYLKSLLYIFIGLLITSFIITLIEYFNIFNQNTIKHVKTSLIIISLFIGGLYIGKNSSNKGYLNGLKISIPIILVQFTINCLFLKGKINIYLIIYYIIIIASCILGSIIGINKRLKNKL